MSRQMTEDTTIIELCCSRPKSPKELSSILKLDQSQVNKRMKRLVSKNQLMVKYLDMKHPVYGIFEV